MNLEEIIISEITGEFTIEAYQRGYRWGKDEVEHLLEDSKLLLVTCYILLLEHRQT